MQISNRLFSPEKVDEFYEFYQIMDRHKVTLDLRSPYAYRLFDVADDYFFLQSHPPRAEPRLPLSERGRLKKRTHNTCLSNEFPGFLG